jgi:methylmalonyl-CoA/ethylmalonyl-CoA epimerase
VTDLERALDLPALFQIGIVVPALARALGHYEPIFGPFEIMEAVHEGALFRGRPQDCAMTIAFGHSGSVEIEIIEPRSGSSPQQEFLDSGGLGMHHVGFRVEDHDRKVRQAARLGFKAIWSHRVGDIAWSYLERENDPLIVELLQMPS